MINIQHMSCVTLPPRRHPTERYGTQKLGDGKVETQVRMGDDTEDEHRRQSACNVSVSVSVSVSVW